MTITIFLAGASVSRKKQQHFLNNQGDRNPPKVWNRNTTRSDRFQSIYLLVYANHYVNLLLKSHQQVSNMTLILDKRIGLMNKDRTYKLNTLLLDLSTLISF